MSKLSREFSGFFWNLFSFSLSYFYLLEGSKIFFMSSKYFIWIVHTSIYLWEFSWNFCDFRSIFSALKHFSGFVFALKRISKEKKSNPSSPTGPSPRAWPSLHRPGREPHGAHLSPAAAGAAAHRRLRLSLGCAPRQGSRAPRPYKRGANRPRVPCCTAASRPSHRPRRAPRRSPECRAVGRSGVRRRWAKSGRPRASPPQVSSSLNSPPSSLSWAPSNRGCSRLNRRPPGPPPAPDAGSSRGRGWGLAGLQIDPILPSNV
jgi:hypothetical protein